MTGKLKAPRFRIRRSAPPLPEAGPEGPEGLFDNADDGFGDQRFPTAGTGPEEAAGTARQEDAEIAAIRAEGLTGRQLRMARRVALRHGIAAESDHEAVLLLRQRGIDPFRHKNMLELVLGAAGAADTTDPDDVETRSRLPQALPRAGAGVPALDYEAENRRARELMAVQRDIARRRRWRLAMLVLRLTLFIFLPAAGAGYYFYAVATPMYATNSEFVIQQAQPQGAGAAGSLFSGTAMATAQDSMTVQSYLQSREAMLRLDAALGFKAAFSAPAIDPLQRLEPAAANEDAYDLYSRYVTISYDPTEGIIKMEVLAPDPGLSAAFSRALISYAEEQVDHLTQRLREDQMAGARETYQTAENNVRQAQQRVIELQEQRGVISGQAEVQMLMSQIATFEVELRQERLDLEQILQNPSPNRTRVEVAQSNIARLEALIADMRADLTDSGGDSQSLARISGELMIAEGELETRRMLLAQSLQQMETARIEANRQVRYLSTGVSPVAPDKAAYPRAFENTAVAFLILSGIYLMLSLTFSILREQVSA